jgi:thiol-disulfide isomerase/thioredoxin
MSDKGSGSKNYLKTSLRLLAISSAAIFATAYWIASRPVETIQMESDVVQTDSTGTRTGGTSGSSAGSLIDKPAIPVSFYDLNDEKKELTQFKGKPILLNFWATWCPPCVEEFPSLVKLAESASKEFGLQLVMISVDENKKDVVDFLKKKGFSQEHIRIFMDRESAAAIRYGTQQFPETFFVDKNFNVKRKFVGAMDWNSKELLEWLRKNSQ